MRGATSVVISVFLSAAAAGGQHQHHATPEPTPSTAELPRMGKSQENPEAPLIELAELQRLAFENNPTLAQADAEIRTGEARKLQSGLYPNPTAGYVGEEIRGGPLGGGQHGFFVSQTLVTGGKLGLNREIAGHDVRISELEAEEQSLRVLNAVKLAFYRMLAAQEMLDLERDLLSIAEDKLQTERELENLGQADDAELLQVEVERQHREMRVRIRETGLRQSWRSLAAIVGVPDLPARTVRGSLEDIPTELEENQVLERLTRESPAVRIAHEVVARTRAELTRAQREPIPNLELRGGLQDNRQILESTGARVGLQGFLEVGVPLPLFNRNQGNVSAAEAQLERSEREVERVALVLRERASSHFEVYETSRIMVERYRNELLPRAQRAYELRLQSHGLMLGAYPQVLEAQARLFEMQAEYVSALEIQWMNAIALSGLLLTDGLEAPARPGDVDMPVREINVPTLPRAMERN
ncbi:MAG TPA: TolC family protein [Vicinamibacteria bacterium]|nr:TolC family protein [Vicinamibacteria bacterium]